MAATVKQKRKRRSASRGKSLPRGEHGGIQLLLIQSVDHLGKQGDVVDVKPGHAKNYLIPQGLATVATEHHKRMVDKHRSRLQEIEKQRMAGLIKYAEEVAKQSVTIEANANDEGHLYGSVGQQEIVDALKPEFVVPLVVKLCDENSSETCGLFEVGAGFIAKLRWERTQGVNFGISGEFTAEDVLAAWDKITDFTDATHPADIGEANKPVFTNLKAGG